MSPLQVLYLAATVLLGAGLWQLLPNGTRRPRTLGIVLTGIGLLLYALLVPVGMTVETAPFSLALAPVTDWLAQSVFLIMAGVTVISAICAVSLRNPLYCAIWFALMLLGTAGLFVYQGAQFLGVATVVVYAGAILVTFLFVLMLAQPEGHAAYDRVSWEGFLSACAGALMVGVMTAALAAVFQGDNFRAGKNQPAIASRRTVSTAVAPADQPADQKAVEPSHVLDDQHMARLGGQLFSKHLIAVELAGTLLMVALVGTIAIVGHAKTPREPADSEGGLARG